jgi:hypothetical protein
MTTKIATFSIRVPEKALACWLEHFFATVEQVRKDGNGN